MRTRKRAPAHPGRILKNHYLDALPITITDPADILGVSRKTASKIINERGSVTPDMALRLSRVFSTSPDLWMTLQKNYDLWHAAHDSKEWKSIKPIKPSPVMVP